MASAPLVGLAAADAGDIRVLGSLPFGYDSQGAPPHTMHVDSTVHRGFVQTQNGIVVYDLVAMRPMRTLELPPEFNSTRVGSGDYAAVDEANHRIFWLQEPALVPFGCSGHIMVLDTIDLTWTRHAMPCFGPGNSTGFYAGGLSYDAGSNKVYVVGYSDVEFFVRQQPFNQSKEQVYFRQLDADTMALDWEVDASRHCDWVTLNGFGSAAVRRSGNTLISYCYQGGMNERRGHVLTMPLADNRPVGGTGNEQVTMSPTFAAMVKPRIDAESGRVLMTAESPPFGPAVWAYDARASRFLGVIPTGFPHGQGFASGYDERRGRLYYQSSAGFLAADTRHDPLPGGISYPAMAGQAVVFDHLAMAVDSGLRRIMVPLPAEQRYAVVEDDSAPPQPKPPIDYDQGTADIAEEPGKTARAYSAAATAYGVHILNTGGIPAAIQGATRGADCNPKEPSQCASSTVLTSGNREYFTAQSSIDLGSSTGASAFGSPARASPNDRATDGDVRAMGTCQATKLPGLSDEQRQALADQCHTPEPLVLAAENTTLEGLTFENMRRGTSHGDFPVEPSLCSDFGGAPGERDSNHPSASIGSSKVTCDAAGGRSSASAESAAMAAPGLPGPLLAVGHSRSELRSQLTEEGTVTTSVAEVSNIRLGDLVRIGRVTTTATTKARGRTGTSSTTFSREIADVETPTFKCATNCDADRLVQSVNQLFGGKLRAFAHAPFEVASRRGYTALVSKDPSTRDSDRAVNDDETVTVEGLTFVFYNDSFYHQSTMVDCVLCGRPTGSRNRVVVGLAGVQAESHYGVFPLPETGDPTIDTTGGSELTEVTDGSGLLAFATSSKDSNPGSLGLPTGGPVNPLIGAVTYPGRALAEALRLIVNAPGKALVLFVFWLLLASPLYLALRRRALAAGLSS